LTKKVYRRVPVLVNETTQISPWEAQFKQGLFNITSDSHLFRMRKELEQDGFSLDGNIFLKGHQRLLPVYEAKMIWHFDHRFASLIGRENAGDRPSRKFEGWYGVHPNDPHELPIPRYWVLEKEVETLLNGYERKWLIAFRDITSVNNQRTSIFAVVPRVGQCAHLVLLPRNISPALATCFLANVNSLVFDYVARQKIAGTHMNFFYLKQLPVLPPDCYQKEDVERISRGVLELTYTAHDLKAFAEDLGYAGFPFKCSGLERATLLAELDAYYAHLYGLTRDELCFVLDPKSVFGPDFSGESFRVLKDEEEQTFGEFRTRRLVLSAYDELANSDRFAGEKRESAIEAPKGRSVVTVRDGD